MGSPDYKTVEGLKLHPLFQLLSRKQQEFVLAFIELKGDRVAAAKQVYSAKKPDAVAMRALRTAYIRQLLAIHYGYDADQARMTKTELAGLIAARLRKISTSDRSFAELAGCLLDLSLGRKHAKKRGRPTNEETAEHEEDAEVNIDEYVREMEANKTKV